MKNGIKITFDSEVKNQVLAMLEKSVDSEGFIIEKSDDTRVLTIENEQIKAEELAGLRVGSEIFIKKDLPSVMDLSRLK